MNYPNIIIGGHINAGKTTIANYLINTYKYNKYSLGDGVKHFVSDLYSILHKIDPNIQEIELDEMYNRDTKEQHREKMQLIATELIRKYFGDDIWLKYIEDKIKFPFVIDDLRFENEYSHFKKMLNTIYIRVIRDEEILSDHISENQLDDTNKIKPDYVIKNINGDLNKLYDDINMIIDSNTYSKNDV